MSKVVFLEGKKVSLRPVSKLDVPLLQRWINDPKVRHFIKNVFPMTEIQEENWVESLSNKNSSNIVLVIETKDGIPIGTMGIHNINWINRTASTGALLGEKEYWGQGFGSDAKMILLDYAFNTLGLRKINSRVYSFNKRSRAYLKKTGYVVEGVQKKQILRNGRYVDIFLMAVFKEKFIPLWKKYKKKK
jgi:RimJ/RimL family protein N-acetyltransferase